MSTLKTILWLFPALAIQTISFVGAFLYTCWHFPFDVWASAKQLSNITTDEEQ